MTPSSDLMTAARFQTLWKRCLYPGASDASEEIFKELYSRYSEPHRHYHTRRHIAFCLELFEWAKEHMDSPDIVELGVWFHDLIYDTTTSGNELRSAQRFVVLADGVVDPVFIGEVYDMILSTCHRQQPAGSDARYLVDIDLSSFGQPWDLFKLDSEAVRAEYAGIPEFEFYSGQLTFLRALMARASIYSTNLFREFNERTARENITRYMEELEAQGFY